MPTETQHLEQRVAALQSDLNKKDEQIDALTFSDNDRELSRRSWFEAARAAEKLVEKLRAQMAERDALHQRAARVVEAARAIDKEAFGKGTQNVDPGRFRGLGVLLEQYDAALSASAEPVATRDWCATMERPKSKCGCPDCGSSIVQICVPAERDERSELSAKNQQLSGLLQQSLAALNPRGALAIAIKTALERKP